MWKKNWCVIHPIHFIPWPAVPFTILSACSWKRKLYCFHKLKKHHIQRCDGLAQRFYAYFQLAWGSSALSPSNCTAESPQDFGVFKEYAETSSKLKTITSIVQYCITKTPEGLLHGVWPAGDGWMPMPAHPSPQCSFVEWTQELRINLFFAF